MPPTSTSERILRHARRILDRHGPDAVTMRVVAKAVGITPMALYRHFPDREGLLSTLANRGFENFAAQLTAQQWPQSVEKSLDKLLDLNLDFALSHPHLFELMFLRPRPGARQFPADFRESPTAGVAAAIIQRGIDCGLFRRDDPWEITFESGALLQGLVMLWIGGRFSGADNEFRALCHRSFRRYLHGIRK